MQKQGNAFFTKVAAFFKGYRLEPSQLVFAIYILLLLSRFIDASLITRENEYLSIVLLQLMIFMLPAAIYCKVRGGGAYIRSSLRATLIKPSHIVLLLSAFFALVSGEILLTIAFGGSDSMSYNFSLYNTFISRNDGSLRDIIYLIMAYAVLPSVCEEFVFRGILCADYENKSVLRAIVVSTLFFGLLHFDLMKLPVYLFTGFVFALLLYATRSILAPIIVHFACNLFGLFGQPTITAFYKTTGSIELFSFILGVIFLLSSAIFCGRASTIYKNLALKNQPSDYRAPLKKGERAKAYAEVLLSPLALLSYIIYLVIAIFALVG